MQWYCLIALERKRGPGYATAIELADGVPIDDLRESLSPEPKGILARLKREGIPPGGHSPTRELLRNRMSRTLRAIVMPRAHRLESTTHRMSLPRLFYKGAIANASQSFCAANGGLLRARDAAAFLRR